MKVLTIVGARPQFIKAAPLSLSLRGLHDEIVLHSGQHFDAAMSAIFFDELGLPAPTVQLHVGGGTATSQIAGTMLGVAEAITTHRPDVAVVFGDTNTTLGGALAAIKCGVPLAHIEAGLRSGVATMPEEQNRVLTDHVASALFCPTQSAAAALAREGIRAPVYVVGDIMLDAMQLVAPRLQPEQRLSALGVERAGYVLATLHRAANVDIAATLERVFAAFGMLPLQVLMPLHPRTRAALARAATPIPRNVRLIEPLSYLDLLAALQGAAFVMTDSGGLQKEAYWSGVRCLTLRDETEWPETLVGGWNTLVGTDPARIAAAAKGPTPTTAREAWYGDGHAAAKIAAALGSVRLSEPNRLES